jgi:demethylmenaquinone methyltransferase / 2-methoxy-6-polyprenyl-1,4-benzoquinol methylase
MYCKDDPATIRLMFDSIAHRYDFTNGMISLLLHKPWNRRFIHTVLRRSSPSIFVDLCAGTGEIALDYLRTTRSPCQAYLVDFSPNMLACAQRKAAKRSLFHHQIAYIEADVQELPLPNELTDCITMAYGIRNVKNMAGCIQEAFRVLRPGGCFGVLELTRPRSSFLRLGHTLYLRTVLPLLGKCFTRNRQAYEYLCESIHTFVSPQELQDLFTAQGFIQVQSQPLAGGIATIFIGYKPKA